MGLLTGIGLQYGLLESSDARCPKNLVDHSFLFGLLKWKSEGYHDLKLTYASIWGASDWKKYQVYLKCTLCGAELHRFGLTEVDLIRAGIEIPK